MIQPLLDESQVLRDGTEAALTLTSSELIQEQIQQRKEFRMKLREAKNELDNKLADLNGYKRVLSIALGYQQTDIEKLEAFFWDVLREERDATRDTRPRS